MTKLDGNERWKSRMLLTEHQEQYEHRQDPKPSGRPTTKELELIRSYVVLPRMLTMTERALQDLERSTNIFRPFFARLIQLIMDQIAADLRNVRKELRESGIKIIDEESQDDILYFQFICRGYEDRFGMVREVLRSEIAERLSQYGRNLFKCLEEETKNS